MSMWDRLRALVGGGRDDVDPGRKARGRGPGEPGDDPEGDDDASPGAGAAPRAGPAAAAGAPRPTAEGRERDDIAGLARVGARGGPSAEEALAILRRARGTVREAEAVALALRATQISEPVRVLSADILSARGEEEAALRALEGASSVAGLVLAADLHAARGQLARAVGTIERVLARDIDAPGAQERHRRWRASLGLAPGRTRHLDEATIVAARPSLAPFRLVREAARGGSGAVYEAEDELLGRRVAFKVYHRRGADRALLEREVRTAAALAGPGVVRVFDADPAEGWVALEWVARGSVRDVLRSGNVAALLPFERWARPLARAISRVHEGAHVHADVKPANVLLRQLADPVLGDFGIARRYGEAGDAGSPGYVSPERLAGRPSDPRDDVYGYGRVLEDVLHRVEVAVASGAVSPGAAGNLAPWRLLALRCVGPDERRPTDGRDLVASLP